MCYSKQVTDSVFLLFKHSVNQLAFQARRYYMVFMGGYHLMQISIGRLGKLRSSLYRVRGTLLIKEYQLKIRVRTDDVKVSKYLIPSRVSLFTILDCSSVIS